MVTEQQEWGMEISGVMTLELDLPTTDYPDDGAIRQFYMDARARLATVPGVTHVAVATARPAVEQQGTRPLEIEGEVSGNELERRTAVVYEASPGLLDLLAVPLIRGRDIGVQDTHETVPVALVSVEAARRHFGEDDPIGRRIRIGSEDDAPWMQIVGVVGDIRSTEDDLMPRPTVYVPFAQNPVSAAVLFARTLTEPTTLAAPLSAAVWQIDPNLPIDDTRTMERVYSDNLGTTRALLTLFVTFAVFALLMAGIGIYGVMSYMVSQRGAEISIRMALGAERGKVRRMVLWQGGRIVLLGSVFGLAGAALLARAIQSQIFGISALDPVTFLGVPGLLVAVALIANYVPARRATRIDPMSALRME